MNVHFWVLEFYVSILYWNPRFTSEEEQELNVISNHVRVLRYVLQFHILTRMYFFPLDLYIHITSKIMKMWFFLKPRSQGQALFGEENRLCPELWLEVMNVSDFMLSV
jgi:hypothetical protein